MSSAFGIESLSFGTISAKTTFKGMFAAVRRQHNETPCAAGAKVYFNSRVTSNPRSPTMAEVFGFCHARQS